VEGIQDLKDMEYFRNTVTSMSFLQPNHPHSDDIALDDMEAGTIDTSIQYAHFQYAHSHIAHPLDPYSFANNTAANPALSSTIDMPIPLFPSAEIGSNRGVNNKRSQNHDGPTKVRVVEQTSNMPSIVCFYFSHILYFQ
jgi:hypothetical protein